MTTIVAVQLDDRVIIGADNQTTSGSGRKYNPPQRVKISERGKYIIAGAGDVRACDIAQVLWTPPNPTSTDRKNLYHFMLRKIIPSLKDALKEHDYKIDPNDNEAGFLLLVAIDGQVFEIADDFSVTMSDHGIYAIGSGSSYAIGALFAKATITEALEIAEANDIYTSRPFTIVEQFKN